MDKRKIALVAHDNCKKDLLKWAKKNINLLSQHTLFATGTTGNMLRDDLGMDITVFKSGPSGGDLQIGAAIVNKEINQLVFLWDPMEPHPHDVDVKALLRIATLYNIPIACNIVSADFMITSPLMNEKGSIENNDVSGIIDELINENKALVEKYQSGFKSILGTLADKAIKKLKGTPDKETVKKVLEETLDALNSDELSDEQKKKILSVMGQMFNSSKYSELVKKYLKGDDTMLTGIAKGIKVVQSGIRYESIFDVVKEHFESYKATKE